MLTHIVIWKYRADVDQATRQEHVARLSALPSLIPNLNYFSVGTDVLRIPRSYDTGLVALFQDRAALDKYNDHPEHLKVVEFGRALSEHVASVDFES